MGSGAAAAGLFRRFYDDFDRDAAVQMMQRLGIQPKQQIKQMSKGTREKGAAHPRHEPQGEALPARRADRRRRPRDARLHSQHHHLPTTTLRPPSSSPRT